VYDNQGMTNKENETMVKEMKLSECKNMMQVLAAAHIKQFGEYRCTVNGQKIVVRK
jgi:hypothetical protein